LGTNSSDVIDLFLSRVDDYHLTSIFQISGSLVFNQYTEPWLLDAINTFSICTQDLTFTPTSGSVEGYFAQDLTMANKIMLSKIMVGAWMAKEVQNSLYMRNLIQDHDMKVFSPALNLKERQNAYNAIKEQISQDLVEYSYRNNNWTEWKNQQFD
jgi:hypothetical protein